MSQPNHVMINGVRYSAIPARVQTKHMDGSPRTVRLIFPDERVDLRFGPQEYIVAYIPEHMLERPASVRV